MNLIEPHSVVRPGSRWLTRSNCPRSIMVHEVDHGTGFAKVLDEITREFWLEKIETVESWTRRTSNPRLRAVLTGEVQA
jgi:hypothetical protein